LFIQALGKPAGAAVKDAKARKAKTAKSTKASSSLKLQALKQNQAKPVTNVKPKAGAKGGR
jgi:hypothetical protein